MTKSSTLLLSSTNRYTRNSPNRTHKTATFKVPVVLTLPPMMAIKDPVAPMGPAMAQSRRTQGVGVSLHRQGLLYKSINTPWVLVRIRCRLFCRCFLDGNSGRYGCPKKIGWFGSCFGVQNGTSILTRAVVTTHAFDVFLRVYTTP